MTKGVAKGDLAGSIGPTAKGEAKSAGAAKGGEGVGADAGRNASAISAPAARTTPDCVLCGCCLEGCPLFAATGREELSPRAKALLAGPSKFAAANLPEGGLPQADVAALTGLCLACGRCEKLCPQGVKVPALMTAMRAAHPDFRQWLWKQWITRLGPFWSLAARGAAALPEAFAPASLGLALKGLKGLRPGAGLAPWLTLTEFPVEAFRQKHGDRPVAVFDGCVGSGPRTVWADTARQLLGGLGARLTQARFSCCGSTLGTAGLPVEQHDARRKNVAAWREAGRPLLVTYCATCRKGLAEYLGAGGALFADQAEQEQWRAALVPLSSLLLGVQAKADSTESVEPAAPSVVGYHRPCHADLGDGLGDPDHTLLAALLGPRLRVAAKGSCCGFGGILQLGAPQLSEAVGRACWAGLDAACGQSAPAYVLSGCSGCVMQLSATAPAGAGTGHWLEIVRRA
ncbi:(Fe-S)-binding protein [Humidesulfovibrio sp.]